MLKRLPVFSKHRTSNNQKVGGRPLYVAAFRLPVFFIRLSLCLQDRQQIIDTPKGDKAVCTAGILLGLKLDAIKLHLRPLEIGHLASNRVVGIVPPGQGQGRPAGRVGLLVDEFRVCCRRLRVGMYQRPVVLYTRTGSQKIDKRLAVGQGYVLFVLVFDVHGNSPRTALAGRCFQVKDGNLEREDIFQRIVLVQRDGTYLLGGQVKNIGRRRTDALQGGLVQEQGRLSDRLHLKAHEIGRLAQPRLAALLQVLFPNRLLFVFQQGEQG